MKKCSRFIWCWWCVCVRVDVTERGKPRLKVRNELQQKKKSRCFSKLKMMTFWSCASQPSFSWTFSTSSSLRPVRDCWRLKRNHCSKCRVACFWFCSSFWCAICHHRPNRMNCCQTRSCCPNCCWNSTRNACVSSLCQFWPLFL